MPQVKKQSFPRHYARSGALSKARWRRTGALSSPEIGSLSVVVRSSSAGKSAAARSRTPPFVLPAFAAGRSQRHDCNRPRA